MYSKINDYLKLLSEESSMYVQKVVHEIPALGLVSAVPTSKEIVPDNKAVMDDFDRFIDDILASMEQICVKKEAEMVAFILGQADVQAATGMLPDLPNDGDDLALATWLGKAKMMGFKDSVLNSWSME